MGFGRVWGPGVNQGEDLRCHFATCHSALGSKWRGVVASERALWDHIEIRVCSDCVRLINEGERKNGWILRMSPEGWLWFDTPLKQMQWGTEKAK